MQIEAHASRFDSSLKFYVWGRSHDKAKALADELSDKHSIQIAEDLEAACKQADIIVTTTASTKPIIKSEWINLGTHITAIGADAPGKQELEPTLVAKADLIVADSKSQCIDHGEIEEAVKQGLVQKDNILELGEKLADNKLGRTSPEQITIADLTGVAAQDVAIAGIVLNALDKQA